MEDDNIGDISSIKSMDDKRESLNLEGMDNYFLTQLGC